MTIDTETAKQLLKSNDFSELIPFVNEFKNQLLQYQQEQENNKNTSDDDDNNIQYIGQLIKLQILLRSRIIQLLLQQQQQQQQQNDDNNNNNNETLSIQYYEMGILWMKYMNDPIKAIGQYTKSLECNNNHHHHHHTIQTLMDLSYAHVRTKQYAMAIENIEKVITIQEQEEQNQKETDDHDDTTLLLLLFQICTSYVELATIYEHQANFQQAIEILKKAANKFNNIPVVINDSDSNSNNFMEYNKIKSLLYGRLGILQEKIGLLSDSVISLQNAIDAMNIYYGPKHIKTQETIYLLQLAQQMKK